MNPTRNQRGFTLVELMVAMTLGMLLTAAMSYVYLTSKSSFSRQQQLSGLQQSVRIAFDYLSNDARMVGHMGCYTGMPTLSTSEFTNLLSATALATHYAQGVEGYEYGNGSIEAYSLGSAAPANITTAASWRSNVAADAIATLPLTTLAGSATGDGLTPGSDVLVIRSVAGRPVRLAATANTGSNQTTFTMETMAAGTGTCSNGSTAKVSGLCANSHALIASCSRARVFQVQSITAGTAPAPSTVTLKTGTNLGGDPVYAPAGTEIFPMQTIAYYVKRSSSGTSTSLYRRIFDGDNAAGLEQELIEGVENLQIRYGVDTTSPTADGVVDQYVVARGPLGDATDSVTDWSRVVSVRMGLLVRSTQPIEGDLAAALPASAPVNGVAVTFPTTGPKFDRRVFTTTVAVRNRIPY